MSFTPNFSIAILSIPSPNAKPKTFTVNFTILQDYRITIPQPKTSSHFPPLILISTSADGSVNGKYDGLNLTSTSLPNKNSIILYMMLLTN